MKDKHSNENQGFWITTMLFHQSKRDEIPDEIELILKGAKHRDSGPPGTVGFVPTTKILHCGITAEKSSDTCAQGTRAFSVDDADLQQTAFSTLRQIKGEEFVQVPGTKRVQIKLAGDRQRHRSFERGLFRFRHGETQSDEDKPGESGHGKLRAWVSRDGAARAVLLREVRDCGRAGSKQAA
jgi:hypothetical protein